MKKNAALLCLALLMLTFAAFGDDQSSDLQFVVLKAENGKPVRNASVILHSVDKNGKQEKDGLQTKTDSDGKASMRSIPYGKLRVQVIAHGFQTFGDDFEVNQPKQSFEIKLKPPQKQYSIYDK